MAGARFPGGTAVMDSSHTKLAAHLAALSNTSGKKSQPVGRHYLHAARYDQDAVLKRRSRQAFVERQWELSADILGRLEDRDDLQAQYSLAECQLNSGNFGACCEISIKILKKNHHFNPKHLY